MLPKNEHSTISLVLKRFRGLAQEHKKLRDCAQRPVFADSRPGNSDAQLWPLAAQAVFQVRHKARVRLKLCPRAHASIDNSLIAPAPRLHRNTRRQHCSLHSCSLISLIFPPLRPHAPRKNLNRCVESTCPSQRLQTYEHHSGTRSFEIK